jgi:hypothetical protein
MVSDVDCYVCGAALDELIGTVSVPRLGIKLHLSCYERDVGDDNSRAMRLFRISRPDQRRTLA